MAKMPKQKPGKSKQDYETPRELLDAVEHRFGKLTVDLAATNVNSVCPRYISPDQDSLTFDWSPPSLGNGNLWLNPPFAHIASWAKKCTERRFDKRWTHLLVPASVGSNWYSGYVHGLGYVLALNPRVTFVGETKPYPKDILLVSYGFGLSGFEPWRWDL